MVYIQSDIDRKLPHHFDCACGLYGALDHGLDIRLTSFEEVQSGKFDNLIRSNVFIGSVEFMKEVFSRIGKTDIRVPENSNRQHLKMTLGEAKILSKSKSIFIKPFDIKLFTGFVLDQMVYSSISDVSDDTMVMVYDIFPSPIKSEWRCYIGRDRIVDIRNYSGDIFTTPDEGYLESVISSNKGGLFPTSYTIDIGILENGDNVVIEYNDMWAIGNYGIDNYEYFSLLKSRYFEIVK
jgi:hypothetical protein